jgi:phospholipase/carboxylesterase
MTLNGAKIAAPSGTADSLAILCHGYGADGSDLIGLAPFWQNLLPHTAFIAPNAPEPCAAGGAGYQWFPISPGNPQESQKHIPQAAEVLDAFITEQLNAFGFDEGRLALIGFSQGTIMSLHVGLRRAIAPAAIVGFSGALAMADKLNETKVRPPVFLIHGDSDPMISPNATIDANEKLNQLGCPCQYHISENCGHSIMPDGLERAGQFLQQHLKA